MTTEDYYILECLEPDDWDDSAIIKKFETTPAVDWWKGEKFSIAPKTPIHVELLETHTDRMLPMDNTNALIVSKALFGAFKESGVSNIDAYEAAITHSKTGFKTDDYYAVNILGRISCLKKNSKESDSDIKMGLKIDSKKIEESGLLMLRVDEEPSAIVIHSRVKEYLEKKGIEYLSYIPANEWMG